MGKAEKVTLEGILVLPLYLKSYLIWEKLFLVL